MFIFSVFILFGINLKRNCEKMNDRSPISFFSEKTHKQFSIKSGYFFKSVVLYKTKKYMKYAFYNLI